MTQIRRSCPMGMTFSDVVEALGGTDGLREFYEGPEVTMNICDGRDWDRVQEKYVPNQCASNPHGTIWQKRDVVAFLRRRAAAARS